MAAEPSAPGALTAQLLSGTPATSPEAVTQRLLAVQARTHTAHALAVRSRSVGVPRADVDDALTAGRLLDHLAEPRHAAPRQP